MQNGKRARRGPRDGGQAGRRACQARAGGAARVYYMDPPDGGDVSVSEQLRCMAKDAERYRLLRRKFAIISDGEATRSFA